MEINQLKPNFFRFTFPPRACKHFGFNLYAFLHEGASILLDSGFREHAGEVSAWLNKKGCPIQKVIISHFHHDHIFGLKALPGVEVLGGERFQETLDLYTRPEEQARFRPGRLISEGDHLTFGAFELRFLAAPGHAACNVYTLIDEEFIHVGDDLMASNDGMALLPSVELARAGDHVASLERLKACSRLTFLLSHGPPISGQRQVLDAIENRQRYLKAVADSPAPIPLCQALAGCTIDFLHTEWHENLYAED